MSRKLRNIAIIAHVDQRGFAMVDVRDDGDVAKLAGHDGMPIAGNPAL